MAPGPLAIRAIAAAALAWLPATASAYFDSGNSYWTRCSGAQDAFESICAAQASSYLEAMEMFYSCPPFPPSVTREQLNHILLQALRNNPQDRHKPAVALAVLEFARVFNCKIDRSMFGSK